MKSKCFIVRSFLQQFVLCYSSLPQGARAAIMNYLPLPWMLLYCKGQFLCLLSSLFFLSFCLLTIVALLPCQPSQPNDQVVEQKKVFGYSFYFFSFYLFSSLSSYFCCGFVASSFLLWFCCKFIFVVLI